MKKKCWCLGLILCLMLTGCASRQGQGDPTATPEHTPTATPEPSGTPTPSAAPLPDPQEDPKGYILACLDQALEGETVFIRFWQHPGSGPSPVELLVAEHGVELRALFSSLEWEKVEPPSYYSSEEEANNAPFNQPGAYSVSIYYGDPWIGWINCGTEDAVVIVGNNGPDSVYLRADGAEELCDKLADLVPSAYIDLGRTRVPPQETKEATLKLYLDTALERLKENGHITDHTIDAYEIIVPDEPESEPAEQPEYPGISYTVTFAVKPAKPELAYWQDVLREDGWVEQTIDWEHIAYDARDGCYGMY